MLPGSTKGGGVAQGTPDTCKTPAPPSPSPVPIPYPNIGQLPAAQKTSTKVKFFSAEVATLKTEIPMSSGDEAGVAGGVVSGGNLQKITFKKGSSKVKVEGQPAAHLTSTTGHNGANANMPAGAQIAPSQTKVLVAP
jgi:hypothetical protein